ncbi:MAG: tetratricopeptide repeat protein [Candidatus Thermoplasmatota archaeon]
MIEIPGRKKILLYLINKEKYKGEEIFPFSYCQEGIAESVQLSQNRASKLLIEMEENGLIEKESRKVKGASNKRYVYFLTEKGEKKAEKVKGDIKEEKIHIKTEDGTNEIKLKDIREYVQGSNSYLFALNNLDTDDVLDLTEIGDKDIFVDREKEIGVLKEYLGEKEDKNVSTLLLKGYMGVGKTHFVKKIEEDLRDKGFDFYEGKSYFEGCPPLFPFQNIFSEILEEKPEIVEEDRILELFNTEKKDWKDEVESFNFSDESFFNKMKNVLESLSSQRSIVLFIDNLQWIDSISFRFIKYLTDELEENLVTLLGAYRKEEVDNPSSDISTEYVVNSSNSKTIEIEPFNWNNSRKLLVTKIGRNDIPREFVEMIHELTGGISLFIEALTDKMLENDTLQPLKEKYPKTFEEVKLPEKVKDLYDLKFKHLDPQEKEVLQLSSCIDDNFSEGLILSAMQGEEKETKEIIEYLKRADVLHDTSENTLDFTHEMTRFTVYKSLSKSKRKSLHERIAESLRDIDEEKDVNHHFMLGKHLEKIEKFKEAVRSYLRGADKAEEIYRNEKAVQLYKSALKLLEKYPVTGIDENKIHENLAEVLERNEDHSEAIDHLKKAKRETDDNKRRLVSLHRKMAGCLSNKSQYKKATKHIEEGQKILSQIEQIPSEVEKEKCKLLKEKGMVCLRKNEFEKCENIFKEMKDLSEKIDSIEDKAEAIHYLGAIAYYRSDFDQAKEHLQRSIEIRKNSEDLMGLADSYNNLGVVFRKLQEPEKALEYYKKANEIEKEIGDQEGAPYALDNIGIIYHDLGKLDKSIEYHKKCLDIEKKRGNKHGIAATLDNIGVVYFSMGEFDEALEYHQQSLELKKELEDRSGISFSLYNMGLSYRGKSDFEEAIDHLEKSLEIRKELEDKLNIGYSKLWIGITYLNIKDLDRSEEHLKNALDIFKKTESDHGMGMALTYLGRLKVFQNSLDEAKKYLEHSEKIKSKLEEESYKLIVDRHFAEFYLEKNRLEKSLAHCQISLRKAKRSDMINQLGKCRKVLGKIYCKKYIFHRGQKEFRKALDIFDETGDIMNKAEVMLEWGNRLIEQGSEEKGEEKRSKGLKLLRECQIDISS